MYRYQITAIGTRANGVSSGRFGWNCSADSEEEAVEKFKREHSGSSNYQILEVKRIG